MFPAREGPEVAANDIFWEGLIVPIALIRLRERATSLITLIVVHEFVKPGAAVKEFVKPVSVYLRYLTLEQVGCD